MHISKESKVNFNSLNVTLDKDSHIYMTPDGDMLPSVTSLIDSVKGVKYFKKSKRMLEAMDLGTAVHLYVEEYIAGNERDNRHPLTDSYLTQFKRFEEEHNLKVNHSEVILSGSYNGYKFAGTTDIIGHLGDSKDVWVIDIKTGGKVKSKHSMQTALYSSLIPNAKYRGCLYLSPDSYEFVSYDNSWKEEVDNLMADLQGTRQDDIVLNGVQDSMIALKRELKDLESLYKAEEKKFLEIRQEMIDKGEKPVIKKEISVANKTTLVVDKKVELPEAYQVVT